MKNPIFLLLWLLFNSTLYGQVKIRPGIRSGLNLANITNTILDTKVGPYVGAFADIRLAKFYALQPEISYSRQGGKSNFSEVNDVNIDYISIAIANKFYVIPSQGLHFIIGPSFDSNINDNFINLLNGRADGEISPFDFSIIGGIGYEFNFGLIIESRYKLGLISIDFFGNDNGYENSGSNYNTVFQFGAGYKFDF